MAIRQTKRTNALKEKALRRLETVTQNMDEFIQNSSDSLDAYMREPYGDEVKGRSQFVTSDYADTVEWIMPSLMRLFTGSNEIVTVNPAGPEDEIPAKLMTQKIHHDFMKVQKGYIQLHDGIKSALMNKYSTFKYWWEIGVDKVATSWNEVTLEELEALSVDTTVEIKDRSENEDGTYDVMGYELRPYSRPKSAVMPPEEVMFDLSARESIQDSEFVAHKKRMHVTTLKKKFKLTDKDLGDERTQFDDHSYLKDTRFEDLGGSDFLYDENDEDFHYIYECYLDEYDDNGVPNPVIVTIYGNKVIKIEDNTYEKPPFAGLTAIRLPHRAAGLSIYDLVGELQKLRTALFRAVMDNIYYQNNGINVINPYRISQDDVINRKEPGATWRTLHDIDPSSAIMPVPTTPVAPQTLQMMDVTGQMRSEMTGVTMRPDEQGMGSQTLNKTSTGISQIMTAAKERIELIARTLAETGITELFQGYVDMNVKFFDQATNIRVNEGWQQINPGDLNGTFDLEIEAGSGAGAKEVKINQITNMLQMVPGIQQQNPGVITGTNLYNMISQMYDLMGYKNTDQFVSDPGQMDQQMQQIHQQYEQQIQQLSQQLEQLQAEYLKLYGDNEKKMADVQTDRMQLDLKAQELELKYGTENIKIASDEDIKNRELDIKEKESRSKATKTETK
jgi:hypothetical protein